MGSSVRGSFRDPSGHLFTHEAKLYRRVNSSYRDHYDLMMASGFYESAVGDGSLIAHEEVPPSSLPGHADAYRVLRPEPLPFISYPYEWTFGQLQDAALLTLSLQKKALGFGLALKDASAFNVQFRAGRPVFIDTLSFEKYVEGRPWVAYRQFCSHFLAPLALIAYRHSDLGKLSRTSIDGIPLDLASRLLPPRTRLRPGLLVHVHLHARSQKVHGARADSAEVAATSTVSRTGMLGIIDSLERCIGGLEWSPTATEWGEYYDDTNYSSAAEDHKTEVVTRFIEALRPKTVWDLGANNGRFSRIASRRGIFTVAADVDPVAVEKNYREAKRAGEDSILPLVMDLTNPSPALGWAEEERMSFAARGPADVAIALALVHHLAISNHVPLVRIAAYFRSLCRSLIVEFVPKSDSQVQRLLRTREDMFPDYTVEGFEAAFGSFFEIREREPIRDSSRILYWLDGVRSGIS